MPSNVSILTIENFHHHIEAVGFALGTVYAYVLSQCDCCIDVKFNLEILFKSHIFCPEDEPLPAACLTYSLDLVS